MATGERLGPIPVKLLGTVRASGELIRGPAAELWSRPDLPQVSAVVAHEVRTFDKEGLLAGRANPTRRFPITSDWVAPSPDGEVVFIAEGHTVRAVTIDGRVLWEQVGPARLYREAPLVSPDGRHVLVLRPKHTGSSDSVQLLDAGTGAVLSRWDDTLSVGFQYLTQRWHRDGRHVVISVWRTWQSWKSFWVDVDTGRQREVGSPFILPTDLLTPTRMLSIRHDPVMLLPGDFHRDNVFINELSADDGTESAEIARLDLLDIRLRDIGTNVDVNDAVQLGAEHVVLAGRVSQSGEETGRHWLCAGSDLSVLGYLDYPDRVRTRWEPVIPTTAVVTPLPDGTWLTDDGSEELSGSSLLHWALA